MDYVITQSNYLQDNNNYLYINKNQLTAKYPCLIILYNKALFEIINDKNYKNTNCVLLHIVIYEINKLLKENKYWPLIEHRNSFGFNTPTLSDVLTGLRLSLGSSQIITGMILLSKESLMLIERYKNNKFKTIDKHM